VDLLTGFFSHNGSPAFKVTVKGPFSEGLEYDAVLDTGFTGFLSLPLVEAIRLGLVLHGTTAVSFADGKQEFRLTARGMVMLQDESQLGVAILEPASTEILLGMGFLRLFGKAFFVSSNAVFLVDEEELQKLLQTCAATAGNQTDTDPDRPEESSSQSS